MQSNREVRRLLSKLKGGTSDPFIVGVYEKAFRNDVQMNKEELKKLIGHLKGLEKALVEAKDSPQKVNKLTKKFELSCRAAGLHEMPDRNGVIAEILAKGSLDDVVKKTYIADDGRLVKCVSEKSAKAMERYLNDPENLNRASAELDKEFEDLMNTVDMLETNMNLIKPFVTGHPKLGKYKAPERLLTKTGDMRKVKGADGKEHRINSCEASATQASCEAKRTSVYGEPGDSCLWMPNYSHLTEQALAWEEETGHSDTWKNLQEKVCVDKDSFPFPMRPITDDDLKALRSGRAWKADPNRAMVKRMGSGERNVFSPNMKEPISSTAKFGYVDKPYQPSTLDSLKSLVGFGRPTPVAAKNTTAQVEVASEEGDQTSNEELLQGGGVEEHYTVKPTLSKYNQISGKPIEMPYFFEKAGPMLRHKPTPVTMRPKPDYEKAAMTLQRMWRNKGKRVLPKRVEAMYEAEMTKQTALRKKAKAFLQKKYNTAPTTLEVEDHVMRTEPEARDLYALLQRLIYDIALKHEWTEAEVHNLLQMDLTGRGDGHVIIVSTEPGMCMNAYKGIAKELDDSPQARQIFQHLTKEQVRQDSKVEMFGKDAGRASLGEVFGREGTAHYKEVQQKKVDRQKEAAISSSANYSTTWAESESIVDGVLDLLDKAENDVSSSFKGLIASGLSAIIGEDYTKNIAYRFFDPDRVDSYFDTTGKGVGKEYRARYLAAKEAERSGDKGEAMKKLREDIKVELKKIEEEARLAEDSTVLAEEYYVAGTKIEAPPADHPALDNVITVLTGGGILPHKSLQSYGEDQGQSRDADTSDKWGLSKIFSSSVMDKMEGDIGKQMQSGSNVCLHKITEIAAILMKADIAFYLPMIQRFYKQQGNRFLSASAMKTSVDARDIDDQASLNAMLNSESPQQKFVREMLFDAEGKVVDAMKKFPNVKALLNVGSKLTNDNSFKDMDEKDRKLFMKSAVYGPSMAQRASIAALKENDDVLVTRGLPYAVWTDVNVMKNLKRQLARGNAGKANKSLLYRLAPSADEINVDAYEIQYRDQLMTEKDGKNVKDWKALEKNMGMKDGVITSKAAKIDDNEFNTRADQVDIARIILEGKFGSTLANDEILQAAFRVYESYGMEERQMK